jgi:type IV pilus biogenesis protein CpaD/CtpE
MKALGNLPFNLILLGFIVVLLASCASTGPSAEPTACRGTAFSINTPNSTSHTAGVP